MIRASGFLLGALLMLAVFLLALSAGFSTPPEQMGVSSKSEDSTRDTGTIVTTDESVENLADSMLPPVTETMTLDKNNRLDVVGDGLALDPQSWNQSIAANEFVDSNEAKELSRYRVWSPFRSEWAAQGFARRLMLATDVPVGVINKAPGSYQVVFSYRDDSERRAMVTQIENVTGLELE